MSRKFLAAALASVFAMNSKLLRILAGLIFAALCSAAPANADVLIVYTANLSGAAESPPNNSPGTGVAEVDINTTLNTMRVFVSFHDLVANTTASHIHCCTTTAFTGTAGIATAVPTFPGFPLGMTQGTYDQTFDLTNLSTYNPAFVTANGNTAAGAMAALLAGLALGEAYLNIHTTAFPSGEIRGFLIPTPLPGALPLFATGLGALGMLHWRRKRKTKAA
jgi:CHRD domain-containing protein